MRIHIKRKDATYDDDQAFCGAQFHPLSEEQKVTTKAQKATCRTCKKLWGKALHVKLVEQSLNR